jgi:hypothetical protein
VGKSIAKGKDGRKRLYGRVSLTVPGWLVVKKVVVAVWTLPTMEEIKYGTKGVKLEEAGREGVKEEKKEVKPAERKEGEYYMGIREVIRQPVPGLPASIPPAEVLRALREVREVEAQLARKREVEAQLARKRLPPITAEEEEEEDEWVFDLDEEEV